MPHGWRLLSPLMLTGELTGSVCFITLSFIFANILFDLRKKEAPENLDTQKNLCYLILSRTKKVLFDCFIKRLRTFNNKVSPLTGSSKALF